MPTETAGITGTVTVELFDEDGNLKHREVTHNLVTEYGDRVYGERGAGLASPPAAPTGMKLGTGSTAPAKTGAGAALVTYLTDSHQAFDSGFPSSALASGRAITYKVTYAAGKATSASTAITEVVIVNEALADATSAAGATVARALLSGIASKQSGDTLAITWTHTLLGA